MKEEGGNGGETECEGGSFLAADTGSQAIRIRTIIAKDVLRIQN